MEQLIHDKIFAWSWDDTELINELNRIPTYLDRHLPIHVEEDSTFELDYLHYLHSEHPRPGCRTRRYGTRVLGRTARELEPGKDLSLLSWPLWQI
jgi:hypothetical protein